MSRLATIPLILRLARREMRGGLRGFGVFLACLFLGVFAISAIGSFTAAAKSGLLADASALLGGDLEASLNHRPLTTPQLAAFSQHGQVSQVMTMRTMARTPDGTKRSLVELKAVDAAYPLYGQVGIVPAQTPAAALESAGDAYGALVEEAFLARVDLQLGDQVVVGNALFTLRGILTSEPDRSIRAFNLGPRLMVSQAGLEATGLVQPGSLISYAYRLRMADKAAVDALSDQLQSDYPDAGWRLRTWRQAAPRVRFFLDRMNLNLTLIGLCALLVGGLGVSGAVRGYLAGKIVHIATMKCLGASGQVIFSAYLLQVLVLGAIGAGFGMAGGAALPFLISRLFAERLPIPLQPAIYPDVLATAAMFGLLIALVFSLKALGVARKVSPSLLFRGYIDTASGDPGRRIWAAIVLAALGLAGLAVLTSSDRRLALWFILGALICFGLFRLLAAGVIRLAARLPRPTRPTLRLGLGNIHRRGSPAASALFSLGLGLTALVIIALVQANLDDMVNRTVPQEAPAFFFLDIQPDQVDAFEATIQAEPGVVRSERYPTLRGRITAIAGVAVEQAIIAPNVQWAVRGDRFLSYATEQPADSRLTAGHWWPTDYRGPPLVSLTADLAKGFGVKVGDSLTVNVLGREVTAQIACLREVDWSTLDLNFAILFAPGVLEAAPQTHIAAVHVPPEQANAVFKAVTGRFPNVSAISTREVLANVSRTLERIGIAFKGMAAVALLTGFLVLAGAVSADQHRRIHDAVIFKVCGATRSDILSALAVEFALLGLAAGALSALIGSLAAYAILKGLMDMNFQLNPATILITLAAGIGLTLVLGLLGTWKALGQKPALYLRSE